MAMNQNHKGEHHKHGFLFLFLIHGKTATTARYKYVVLKQQLLYIIILPSWKKSILLAGQAIERDRKCMTAFPPSQRKVKKN